MKRYFSYILILAVILQIFAPFSVGVNTSKGFDINKKEAEAVISWEDYPKWNNIDEFTNAFTLSEISIIGSISIEGKSSKVNTNFIINTGKESDNQTEEDWERVSKDKNNVFLIVIEDVNKNRGYVDVTYMVDYSKFPTSFEGSLNLSSLTAIGDSGLTQMKPGTAYTARLYYKAADSYQLGGFVKDTVAINQGEGIFGSKEKDKIYFKIAETNFTTATTEQTITGNVGGGTTTSSDSIEEALPACGILGWSKVFGCVVRIIHYVIFKPVSALFAFAGKIMDITLMYSISDSSYRSSFVSEGWKLIRDLCNMFFIFILLYIAFTTILNAGGSKNKASIVNVIIIGLVINFSLFATHLIIDASNIMARVFYNPEVIVVGPKDNSGKIHGETGNTYGEIKLSEAIVSKMNPQRILSQNTTVDSEDGVSVGNYLLIEFLAIGVCIVGMIVFISISFALIARVVMLWLAMILSPLAFLTFAIPQLKDTDYIGWSKWWPDTLKAAFMAPIFVFFLYIIAVFIDSGMGLKTLSTATEQSGTNVVIGIVIAFALVMFLLMTAKKVAVGMAGKVAEKVSSGLKTVGGLALGGAAVGTGAILRNVVGGTVAKASRGETATQKYEEAKFAMSSAGGHDVSLMRNLSKFEKFKGATGSYLTGGIFTGGKKSLLGSFYGRTDGTFDIATKQRDMSVKSGIGGLVNRKQENVDKINKARNKWDETKKDAGLENTDDKNLSSKDVKNMKKKFKDKNKGEYETEAKNGEISLRDASGQEIKSIINPNKTIKGEKTFKADREDEVTSKYVTEQVSSGRTGLTVNNLSKQDKQKIKEKLDMEFRAILKTTVDYRSNEKFKETRDNSNKNISMTDRGIAGANRASYDVRNLTNLKSDKRDSIFSKIPVALITAIAAGVRAGIKGSGMSSGGIKSQGAFLKDMGNVISDSLKISKINVELGGKNKNN